MVLGIHPQFFAEKVYSDSEKNTIRNRDRDIKVFACIQADTFFAQADSNKLAFSHSIPLASIDNGFCFSVNYAALRHGVCRGMPIDQAKKACPTIVLVQLDNFKILQNIPNNIVNTFDDQVKVPNSVLKDKYTLQYYRGEWDRIGQILRKACALIEKTEFEEFCLDITYEVQDFYKKGNYNIEWRGKLLGGEEILPETEQEILLMIGAQMMERICLEIKATVKYNCKGGISYNKMLSRIACDQAKSDSFATIIKRYTLDVLKPLSISNLPNINKQTIEALARAGYGTLEQVQNIDLTQLTSILKDQKVAQWIHDKVRGVDDEPIEENDLRNKSIILQKNFAPVNNLISLEANVNALVSDLCQKIGTFYDQHAMVPKMLVVKFFDNILDSYRVKGVQIDLRKRKEEFFKPIKQKTMEVLNEGLDVIFPCSNIGLGAKHFAKNELDSYEFDLVSYAKSKHKEKAQAKEKYFGVSEIFSDENSENSKSLFDRDGASTSTSFAFDSTMDSSSISSKYLKCAKCQQLIREENQKDHDDFHIAEDLDKELNPNKKKYKRFGSSFEDLKGDLAAENIKPELKKVKKEPLPSKGKKKKEPEQPSVTLDKFFFKK